MASLLQYAFLCFCEIVDALSYELFCRTLYSPPPLKKGFYLWHGIGSFCLHQLTRQVFVNRKDASQFSLY